MHSAPARPGHIQPKGWRGDFKRKIVLVLLAKLVGLFVLWLLFFSPAHRATVDDTLTERRFSLASETGT